MKRKIKLYLLEAVSLIIICSINNALLYSMLWVILHEAVHIMFSKYYGLNVKGINVGITGANARIFDLDSKTENERIIIYLSGPVFNLISAMITFALSKYYSSNFITSSISINLVLFIFNMLPAYPLDGVHIYQMLLTRIFHQRSTEKVLETTSLQVSIIFIVSFCYLFYIQKTNISLLLSGVLIGYSTFFHNKYKKYTLMANIYKKRGTLENNSFLENRNISVYYKCSLAKVMSLIDRNKFSSFYVIDDDLNFRGLVHENELIKALKKYGNISIFDYLAIRKNLMNTKNSEE